VRQVFLRPFAAGIDGWCYGEAGAQHAGSARYALMPLSPTGARYPAVDPMHNIDIHCLTAN